MCLPKLNLKIKNKKKMWSDVITTSSSSITKKSLKKGRFFEHDTRSNTEFYSYVNNSNKKNFDTKMKNETGIQKTEEIINKSIVSVAAVFRNNNNNNKNYSRKKRAKKQKLINDARQMLISRRINQQNCCCHCACSTDDIFIKHKIQNSCGLVDSRFEIGLQHQPISMKELRSVVRFVVYSLLSIYIFFLFFFITDLAWQTSV